ATTSASSLSFGSGISVIFFSTGSPDRVSALSSPGTRPGIRPVIRDRQPGGASHSCPGFLLPFGHRHPLLGHPIPAKGSALLTVGPPARRPDPDGVTAFRTHEQRPGWAPPIPRGQWCSSRPGRLPDRHPPLLSGQSLNPATTSHHARLRFTRHQQGFTHVHPVRSSPRLRPRDGTGSASASP